VESYIARTARKLAVPSKATSEKNPFPPSPELIAEGRSHFADHCASCHANNGSGNSTGPFQVCFFITCRRRVALFGAPETGYMKRAA
jgi:cytochrome c2